MSIPYQPAGYHAITPYLIMEDTAKAIAYYQQVFGAEEVVRMPGPGGKVMHAELRFGDSIVMMSDACDRVNMKAPSTCGTTTVAMVLYVPNVDEIVNRAVTAGGQLVRPVEDQFYGDRSGTVKDPFGHIWTVSTHIEDPTPEQIQQRLAAMGMGA